MRSFKPLLIAAYMLGTAYLVMIIPRSLVVFLLFLASMSLIYYVKLPNWFRSLAVVAVLGI
ncbi:MAG: hypothetical protein ACT4P5_19770, partial [Armatimonadota bacterium]